MSAPHNISYEQSQNNTYDPKIVESITSRSSDNPKNNVNNYYEPRVTSRRQYYPGGMYDFFTFICLIFNIAPLFPNEIQTHNVNHRQ